MSDIKKNDEELIVEKPSVETQATENVAEEITSVNNEVEETPAAEEPVAEEVPAEEPAVEESPAEEPVAKEAPVEEPVAEEASAEEPVAEEAPAEEPVAEEAPAEEPVAEEAVVEETSAEVPVAEDVPASEDFNNKVYESVEEVLERLKQLAEGEEDVARQERDMLKATFYKIHKQKAEEEYKNFIEQGGNPEDYVPTTDNNEAILKELIAIINQKRAKNAEAEKEEREANYLKKQQIIEKIKAILEKPDDVNKEYNAFRALQQEWNE